MATYKISVFDCEQQPPALAWQVDVDAKSEGELAPAMVRVLDQARHETRNPLLNYSLNIRSPRPARADRLRW